jgi:hypothetical protein
MGRGWTGRDWENPLGDDDAPRAKPKSPRRQTERQNARALAADAREVLDADKAAELEALAQEHERLYDAVMLRAAIYRDIPRLPEKFRCDLPSRRLTRDKQAAVYLELLSRLRHETNALAELATSLGCAPVQ